MEVVESKFTHKQHSYILQSEAVQPTKMVTAPGNMILSLHIERTGIDLKDPTMQDSNNKFQFIFFFLVINWEIFIKIICE